MAKRQKVAILGGGPAGITAAFELTSTEELRERYEVTVYQLGWRLGGKCASGRNPHGRLGRRIEEHGLHVWFGFYENAFRMMRETYAELERPANAPLATWRDAFKPSGEIVLYEQHAGRWRGWGFTPPRNPFTPGDGCELPSFWEITQTLLEYLLGRWGALRATNPSVAAALAPAPARLPFGVDRMAEGLIGGLLGAIFGDPERELAQALDLARRRSLEGVGSPGEAAARALLWDILDAFKRWLWRHVVEPHLEDDELRLFFTTFDAASSMLQGIIEDRLIERGFDAINGEDLREWLRRHGALPLTLSEGVFVRGLYDMAFAYDDGDIDRPRMAAGVAVHDALRMFFTYRGAFMWKMQAGMGDTVFTPLYEVLLRRRVRFQFFHWVSHLGLSADRRHVERIEVIPQVQLVRGPYRPLVDVQDLACWPSEPLWEQIVDGEQLRERGVNLEWEANPREVEPLTLRRGRDFDVAVLAIPVAALTPICAELIEDAGNPRFRQMIARSSTTMTQALQLWMKRPVERLGWPFGEGAVMTTFVEPLDTYSDMSQLIPREAWPPEAGVASIAYFCGVLSDRPRDTQQRADSRVRRQAAQFLRRHAQTIWPESSGRAGFDWRLLVADDGARGPARLDAQFWRANFQPSERYVLTPPGSVQSRLRADEAGYENLLLAGDWVRNGLDGGCVEAAVIAGMQAARALCGSPGEILGEQETWLAGSRRLPEEPPTLPREVRRLPRYVEYGGLTTCPSPVDCTETTLYSFFLKGDIRLLERLCRRVFREPSCGRVDVRPLTRYVMLSFGLIERAQPELEPWSKMGWATEAQVAFWIPVARVRCGIAEQIGWFVPSMWVNDPISLSGGREIYGYNKGWGWVGLPIAPGVPGHFTLEVYGGNDDSGRPAGRAPLIEITASGVVEAGAERWRELQGAVAEASRFLSDPEIAAERSFEVPDSVYEEIVSLKGPPSFFLRQFRAIADGRRADGQQITRSSAAVQRIAGFTLLPDFRFDLKALDSHPVAAELGIASQHVPFALEVQTDFVLADGDVLWRA